MRLTYKAIAVIIVLVLVGVVVSCGRSGVEKYGQAISSYQMTAIRDILANPKAYEGKLVTIEGRIVNECPSGCWFYVKVHEGDVAIYVDIGKSGFSIPQHNGRKIVIEGKVVVNKPGPMVQGKGVEIR